ncbi:MAG: hypothetical protein QOJ51_20 [Acidobacteriaceae bacterium]|nr:hypothetical protein [Acidobacteriaceae bacterium]MEA2257195.1 hypothetical protein [Acidobacteriaceae bacterium]
MPITRLEQATAKQHREKEASCLTRRRPDHIAAGISNSCIDLAVFEVHEKGTPRSRKRTVVNDSTKALLRVHGANNRAALCRQAHSLEKRGVSGVAAEVFE